MESNKELIVKFYAAFQQKDYKTMQGLYAEDAVFSDPVYKNLNVDQIRAMWEMFCVKGQALEIFYSNIEASDLTATAKWKANYTFSLTGRKITNSIRAHFIIENGKIISHVDSFNFHWWLKQAFGITGFLFGWTPFLKNKLRKAATKNLMIFMRKAKAD